MPTMIVLPKQKPIGPPLLVPLHARLSSPFLIHDRLNPSVSGFSVAIEVFGDLCLADALFVEAPCQYNFSFLFPIRRFSMSAVNKLFRKAI